MLYPASTIKNRNKHFWHLITILILSGDKVKLPGPSADRPNVYDFGTSYEEIHADLKKKDKTMYTQNGILNMLDRNRRIKYAPQRLQESKNKYDVIFTAEERVYDQCIEHFENTGNVRLVYLWKSFYRSIIFRKSFQVPGLPFGLSFYQKYWQVFLHSSRICVQNLWKNSKQKKISENW